VHSCAARSRPRRWWDAMCVTRAASAISLAAPQVGQAFTLPWAVRLPRLTRKTSRFQSQAEHILKMPSGRIQKLLAFQPLRCVQTLENPKPPSFQIGHGKPEG
jgi:hypothetical protein